MKRRRLADFTRQAPPVRLLADAAPAEADAAAAPVIPERKWIHVASEGAFKGHADGEFKLDRAVFEAFVTRLHADAQFKAGEDGVGINPVIPFDYEHVSELDPREGSVPATGAPAPAWVLDLKVETSAEGKAELWAYAKLGEAIRSQMAKDEYRFVSIAFNLESTDAVTNKAAGPHLTSIAFTNHPFLRDLAPIAARQTGLRNYYGDPAGSAEEGFEFTRAILQLPAATTTEGVIAELAKVVAWAEAPATAPLGVDVAEVMTDLRKAWAVPITSLPSDLLAMAKQASEQLIQPAGAPPSAPVTAPALKESTMSLDAVKKKLAAHFNGKRGVIALDSEEAIVEAVDTALADAGSLTELLKALGFESAGAALQGIPDLLAAKAKLSDALAQLEEAMTMQSHIDNATETADVAAAMSAKGYPDDEQLRTALSARRSGVIAEELKKAGDNARPKQLSEARKAGRRAFLASYGVAPEGQENLLTSLVAGPNGAQLTAPKALSKTPPARKLGIGAGHGAPKTISLSGLSGANPTEKLVNWVRANDPNGATLSWAELNRRAADLKRDENVTIEDAN